MIETGFWSQSTASLLDNWMAREFRYVTRQDEKVCEICGLTSIPVCERVRCQGDLDQAAVWGSNETAVPRLIVFSPRS